MRRRDLLGLAPALLLSADRPKLEQGIQIGDVTGGKATIWTRSSAPGRMAV